MLKKNRIYMLLILVFCMLFGMSASLKAEITDINGHWAESQLRAFINQGLAYGYPDGTFKPDGSISRAEFVTLVNHTKGYNAKAGISFSDVSEQDWFGEEVAKASAAAYISGYQDGSFRPNQAISRQEAASILARVAGLDTGAGNNNIKQFKDAGTIPQWSQGAISAVVSKGFMHGYPDLTYQPMRKISRAEAIVTLNNLVNNQAVPVNPAKLYDKAGVYGPAGGTETITGDVVVSASGVTLQNYIITGNLTLAEGIGNGDVTLKNLTVGGKAIIKGGGSNSISVENSNLPTIIIDKNGVRIVASGKTTVQQVQINTAATLTELNITGAGFETITLSPTIPKGAIVTLEGSFKNVIVQSPGIQVIVKSGTVANLTIADTAKDSNIYIAEAANVNTVELYAPVNITGKGKLKTVKVYAAGANIQQTPENIINPEGLTINIGVVVDVIDSDQAVVVSDVQLTNTFGAFKFATNVVTNADTILAKVKVNGAALKSVEKRSQGLDGTAWKAYVNNPEYNKDYVITCESPFTIVGTSSIRWDGSISAPAVTGLLAEDIGNSGTGSDLRVSFDKGDGENQKINSYRVMIVRSDSAAAFTLSTANAVAAANYTTVAKTGAATYSLTMDAARDTAGSLIAEDVAYKAFVLSVADGTNATLNSLSAASNEITLEGSGDGDVTPAAPVFVSASTNNDGSKIKLSFDKAMANPSGKHGEFTVTVNDVERGTAAAALDNSDSSRINLTLATAVASGDTIKVRYTRGTVLAADGGILATFADQNVNNTLVPAAPVFVSASTNNDGSKIKLSFNKAMANPSGKHGEFTVTVNDVERGTTVAALDNSDSSRINLTLATAVTSGDTIKVRYTQGTILAADGGILATFADQNVNNTLVPAAPVFVSASTNNDGSKIKLSFNKAMANPSGKHGEFTVTVNDVERGTTAAALDNSDSSRINLTLATAVTSGDTIKVRYTQGTILAADGGILATFADQNVNNTLAPSAPSFVSASTNNDGSKIKLSFNKAMANPSGKHGEFTVTVNNVERGTTAAALDNTDSSKINLTLASSAASGDIIKVRYTQGTVLAADGGILANFAEQNVNNTLLPAPPILNAAVVTTNGDISLEFNKDMAVPNKDLPYPENMANICAQFNVKVNDFDKSVTAVMTTNTPGKIKLVLAAPKISSGQIVTIAYTKGAEADQVKAVDGGILDSFAALNVTNNL